MSKVFLCDMRTTRIKNIPANQPVPGLIMRSFIHSEPRLASTHRLSTGAKASLQFPLFATTGPGSERKNSLLPRLGHKRLDISEQHVGLFHGREMASRRVLFVCDEVSTELGPRFRSRRELFREPGEAHWFVAGVEFGACGEAVFGVALPAVELSVC